MERLGKSGAKPYEVTLRIETTVPTAEGFSPVFPYAPVVKAFDFRWCNQLPTPTNTVECHSILDPLPFHNRVNLVRRDIFEALRLSRRPPHFNEIDFRGAPQPEMQPQIIL